MAMSNWNSPGRNNKILDEEPIWEHRLRPTRRRCRMRAGRPSTPAAHGGSEDDCFTLDIALGEALANAVVHGAPAKPGFAAGPSVCLRLWHYRGQIIIEIRDHGPGFDPPAPPYLMPTDYEVTHGRGLPLMEKLTDAMLVSRGDAHAGGVATYLVKKLSPAD